MLGWFGSQDKSLRGCLLENLGQFIQHTSDETISKTVFPAVRNNFADPEPKIREVSVKSVPLVIDKLSERQLDELAQAMTKLLGDRVPALRVNTMICLGMVLSKFSAQTQSRVLLPAFVRGLRDPFVPCRVKALEGIAVAAEAHDPKACAANVLPSVAPLCCDGDNSVRQAALSCCRALLSVVEKHSETMRVEEEKRAAEAKAKADEAEAKAAETQAKEQAAVAAATKAKADAGLSGVDTGAAAVAFGASFVAGLASAMEPVPPHHPGLALWHSLSDSACAAGARAGAAPGR